MCPAVVLLRRRPQSSEIRTGFGMIQYSNGSLEKPLTAGKRKRQRAQQASDAILKAAEMVMDLNEGSSFTLAQVARLAKVARSSIYHHFTSKRALLAAAKLRLEARTLRRVPNS